MRDEEMRRTKAFTKSLKLIDITKWPLEKYNIYTFQDAYGNVDEILGGDRK